LAAIAYLFARRYLVPQLKYISLPADYFPLVLIFSIGLTGILMRYFIKVDIIGVKQMTLGLAALQPTVVEGVGSIFYIHIFLVSVLFAYFPFSKLVHLAGVFLSPTRNLANNSRFGLAAGLISDNPQQQQQFRAQICAGVISINAPTAGASSALPFGGIGASGNHRPSAFYAADYCAWPQAISTGPLTHDYVSPSGTGFRP